MIDTIAIYVGIFGLYLAAFGFGSSISCYLCNAPNTSLYEWLAHWTIVFGALIYMSGFACLKPDFFNAMPDVLDVTGLAFFFGVYAVWQLRRFGI